MGVSAIALYASSPSRVCSTPHPCQINGHTSSDFDMSSRTSSAASSTASASQKSFVGGLSCLFSSTPAVKRAPTSSFCGGGEELGSFWHESGEDLKELSSSFCYSSGKFFGSPRKRDQSPISVLHAPFSCGGGGVVSARSSSVGFMRDRLGTIGLHSPVRSGIGRLFDGFVSNALSSCVDYTSPSFSVHARAVDVGASSAIADELTFNLDDAFVDDPPEPHARELLMSAQLRHKIFCDEFVIKAFYEAEKGHRGQMRASGDPYLHHCVETAVLLAMIGANSTVVAAGLLHDTVDDSFLTYDYIVETFGSGVANLVQGVSKLSHLSKLARENNTASKSDEADRLHTMFLAMADARAVLIKLADRLHNMMTLDALPYAKQRRFAKETLQIFTPLANRLGISSWKEQLENLCFKHLYPQQYKELSSKLVDSFDDAMISSATGKLEHALRDEGISYHVLSGRHKSLYGIFSKMCKKKLTMNDVHDIHGLRLVVDEEEDCYKSLKIVHQLWPQVPGKLKDYITSPKFNGYKSLHTVVTGEDKVPFEIQIRTKEMHLQAEFGFAAHWRYKEGDSQHSAFVFQMVEWARWVVSWQCQTMSKDCSCIGYADSIKPPCEFPSHSDGCPYSYTYKAHCGQEGPVFVILIENDKMSVQEFPANSTIRDLLESAGKGSSRWIPDNFPVKEELRPRINHEPVSDLTSKLNMGDVVELTPSIPDKSLMDYREEMKRMYDRGASVTSPGPGVSRKVNWGS